jgi:hypothetical protein
MTFLRHSWKLAACTTAFLLGMFIYHVTGPSKVAHDKKQDPAPAHRWTPDDEILHESESRLAAAMKNVTVADGFGITNYSDVALTTVVFSCKVDGAEQIFEWDQTDSVVSTMDRIPAYTQYIPSKLVYRLETRKQFEALETNDVAILDTDSIAWLLEHHKVTGCDVFQIGTDWK